MAPSPLQHRRTHNTLLFQKLLNLRDGASPFTLVLDTLEQSGASVIKEFVRRAKIAKSKIIFISWASLFKKTSLSADVFISTRGKPLAALRSEIISHISQPSGASSTKTLLIIDTINPLSSRFPGHLSTFLSSLLIGPHVSLLGTYHTDVPHLSPSAAYLPSPLITLTYIATAILQVHALAQVVGRKRARDRSLPEPVWGLEERREGVLVGMSPSLGAEVDAAVVVEMELRRKSGRGVRESFVLSPPGATISLGQSKIASSTQLALGNIGLLDDHPLYASQVPGTSMATEGEGEGEFETTFSLGLTEKQRKDRDGVVLPYFDAQKDGGALGAGEGGRILYDMGEEDKEDFDDEEDEI